MAGLGPRSCLALALAPFLAAACESQRVELVAHTDDEAADFGRSALREAMVELSATPTDARAYEAFAARVDELMPLFSRKVKRDAELRLCTLAVAPLEAGLSLTAEEQMGAFATTVWPTLLEFPTLPSETTEAYVNRLCASEFALDCNNVVPETWPAILNAKVWRGLKSRVQVAYGRCRWCEDDASFVGLIERSRSIHRQLELAARRATHGGTPADWPIAGPNSTVLGDDVVITFESGGRVTVGGKSVKGGDWRGEIRRIRGDAESVALHLEPHRFIAEFLEIVRDVRIAGYSNVKLVARRKKFPYQAVTYTVDARVTKSQDLEVHNGDTVQILVQALDHRASTQMD
ncbi:MAG: hypothetical protein GY811_24090 [Myxococcales bacterium]|nr:hypothetical protein [Myxococcales bacterium]